MRFFAPFVVLSLSLLSISSAIPNENVIRVPLERKSFITHSPNRTSHTDPTARANSHVNQDVFKSHLNTLVKKYHATLIAYELNTGSAHPMAQAISAITMGIWAPIQNLAIPSKMERRRRQRNVILGDLTSSSQVLRDHRKRDDISLSEANGNMWYGSISVGTPQQNFTVLFDTGSSDLFLPNETCGASCNGHDRYDPTASSTSIYLNKTFELAYRGGSDVSGVQYADNVYMGGYEAANQTLGAATTYSSGLASSNFRPDGLLGMGFPMISILQSPPVFQTMLSNGVMPQAMFGVALSSQSGKSELTIGGTNTNMYQQSTVEYVQVSLAAYWQIPFAGLSRPGLNSTPDVVVVNKTSYAQAIVDTGTTLIVTSDSSAQAYYANVPGAQPCTEIGGGTWCVPCDVIDSITPTLTFGSRNFTVPSSVFNLGPVSDGSTDCLAGLAGGGSVYWIIGNVFLQSVYTIFDVNNTRIGFADLAT